MKTKSMHETVSSEEEIGDAIKEGAITRQYLADPKTIVSALNRLRSTEITSYLQYKQHAYMAVSLLSPGLKTEFEAHALEELQHADTLANRIQQLGGVPVFDLQELAGKPRPSASMLSKERRSSKWWEKISCSNDDKWRHTARSFERLRTRIWSPDNCYSTSCKRRSSMPAS